MCRSEPAGTYRQGFGEILWGIYRCVAGIPQKSRWSEYQRVVFRELLQNSDDALSNAVEIRFETKGYIYRNDSSVDHGTPLSGDRLPDLKTALVRGSRPLSYFVDLIDLARCTDGRLGTTVFRSGMRTGID